MGIVLWIALGFVVGLLVKWAMPDRVSGGLAFAVALGVGGAVVGGLLGTFAGIGTAGTFEIGGLLASLAGALIALFACPEEASRMAYRLIGQKT